MTIISTTHTTTSALPHDASWVRDAIRDLRTPLEQLLAQVMWDDRLGDCAQHLMQAKLHLLSARDASHRWEGRVHPLQQTVAPIQSLDS